MTAYTFPLGEATPHTSGSKAATLAILQRAGIVVPDGFVIPVREYQRHHPHGRPCSPGPSAAPDRALRAAITAELTALFGRPDGGHVAVRSSATDEDGRRASAAGQHDTVLAVRGVEAVTTAVARCWASLHSLHANTYRDQAARRSGERGPTPAMAVLVQRLVDADVSGVLFTGPSTRIEAIPGLGEPLVGGRVTPDAWIVEEGAITHRSQGHLPSRLHREGDQLLTTPLAAESSPCLPDAVVLELDQLGRTIARILDYDADIEWATVARRPHILQARAITAPINHPASALPPQRGGSALARGIAASPGRVTGTTRLLSSPADFHCLRPDDIIVCRATDPAWTPLFRYAGGIITETGGTLSHAAIVARELGIPAVLAVPDATTRFTDGTRVTLDGEHGTVHRA